jgi:hypothetical protein
MRSKEYRAFSEALERVLSVTRAEIKLREAADTALRKHVRKRRKAAQPTKAKRQRGGRPIAP